MPNLFNHFIARFLPSSWLNPVLLAVCLLINGVVLTNAVLNDPNSGPDYTEHLKYISTLARFHLPTPLESAEYYSPPLPYLFPAFLMWSCSIDVWWAAKCAQVINALLSIGLTAYLIKICELIKPGDVYFKLASTGFLGLLTVYYKTFAWVRGEPYVAFWAVIVFYFVLRVFEQRARRPRFIVALGLATGLLALSRQWGLLLVPALICFVGILALKDRRELIPHLRTLAVSLIISFGVAGWFYVVLRNDHGSPMAFSVERAPHFAFSNQPSSFYFGLGINHLFSDPVRPGMTNQLIPIFYSDIWGDYKSHFIVHGKDTRTGERLRGQPLEDALTQTPVPDWLATNRSVVAPYLGRVNLVSLLPSAFALAGLLLGAIHLWRLMWRPLASGQTKALALCMLVVGSSLAGYMWFLIMYPNADQGDTIKATYMLHVFPFVAIMVGNLLQVIYQKSPIAYTVILGLFGMVFVHNLPAIITRYLP
jgi:hypothetical protein